MASPILESDLSKPATALTTVGLAIESRQLWDEVQAAFKGMPVSVVMEQRDLRNWSSFIERLEFLRPAVVLLDITHLPQPLDDCLRSVKRSAPDAALMTLDTSANPETILTVMRAGATEFLYPPLVDMLRKALERQGEHRTRNREEDRPPGKLAGFLSAKGGCGATTIACHLAAELGRIGAPRGDLALLADFDLESGMVGFLMKVKTPYSLVDAVQNLHRLDLSYWNALVCHEWPGLEIIVAPTDYLPDEASAGEPLRRILTLVRSQYARTVVDLGCSLNLATLTALDEIDDIYLVTTLEVPALHRAKQTIRRLTAAGYVKRLHVVLNRMPQRPDVSPEELERILGMPIEIMLPNDYYALHDAMCKGKLLPPGSHLSRHLSNFAMRLAGLPLEKGKRRFGLFG
jgi:pilus assembly protein CpaE